MADTILVPCETCGALFEKPRNHSNSIKHCSVACRFWPKVDKSGGQDGCWEWKGCTDNTRNGGYGMFTMDYRSHRAHRIAYELTHGPIPDGLVACHHCDNPRCCNPSHLFIGTVADNNADRERKGRSNRSPEIIARMAATKRGKPVPAAVLEAAIRANTGKKRSPETLEKMRLAHLGVKRSEETKAKLREAWVRRKQKMQAGKM